MDLPGVLGDDVTYRAPSVRVLFHRVVRRSNGLRNAGEMKIAGIIRDIEQLLTPSSCTKCIYKASSLQLGYIELRLLIFASCSLKKNFKKGRPTLAGSWKWTD